MEKVSRKDRRLSWFLIVCYILFIAGLSYRSAVFAEFDAISPANVLTEDLSSLDFSPSQFTGLSDVVDAKVLLQKENIRNFFDKNFSIDREYGALKNGLLVEDWAHVGAGIGLSETEVVSVYNLWRENKISELSDLRSGDSSAINNLIESSFVDPSSVDGGTVGKLKNGKTLSSASDWENFAKEKGLPAGGAALMGIYFLWRKRKDFEKAQGLARKDSLYMELENNLNKGVSSNSLETDLYKKYQADAKHTFDSRVRAQATPSAPVKSSVVKQYEALAPKRGTIVAQVRKYSGTYHKTKRDIGVTKSRLAYYDSISKKYSASSTANQAQVNRWTRVSNIRSNQIKYASSRGYAFSNIIHKNRYLIKRENYQISSLVQQQSEYIKNQYYKVIKKLQSIPKVDNTPLGKEVRKWENIIKSWKSAAHGQHKQNYLNAIRQWQPHLDRLKSKYTPPITPEALKKLKQEKALWENYNRSFSNTNSSKNYLSTLYRQLVVKSPELKRFKDKINYKKSLIKKYNDQTIYARKVIPIFQKRINTYFSLKQQADKNLNNHANRVNYYNKLAKDAFLRKQGQTNLLTRYQKTFNGVKTPYESAFRKLVFLDGQKKTYQAYQTKMKKHELALAKIESDKKSLWAKLKSEAFRKTDLVKQKIAQIKSFASQKASILSQTVANSSGLGFIVANHFADKQKKEQKALKENLSNLVKNFDLTDIENLLSGTYTFVSNSSLVTSLLSKEKQLEKTITNLSQERSNYVAQLKYSRSRSSQSSNRKRVIAIAKKFGMKIIAGIERYFTPTMWATVLPAPLSAMPSQAKINAIFATKKEKLKKELSGIKAQQALYTFKQKMGTSTSFDSSKTISGSDALLLQMKQYLSQLGQIGTQSKYFAGLAGGLGLSLSYKQQKQKLEASLKNSPYEAEIKKLRSQIKDNHITFEDKLKNDQKLRASYGSKGGWVIKDGFIRDKRLIGRPKGGRSTANQKFARAIASISNYSAIAGGIGQLKYWAKKAYEETKSSYGGWSGFYKEHPFEYEQKKQAINEKVRKLAEAETERKNLIKSQLETLEQNQGSIVDNLVTAKTWLGQSVEARKQNSLTKKIVDAEMQSKTTTLITNGGSAASFSSIINRFREEQETLISKNVSVLLAPVQSVKNTLASFEESSFYRQLQDGLRKLEYYATPKGEAYAAIGRGRVSDREFYRGNHSRIKEIAITKKQIVVPKKNLYGSISYEESKSKKKIDTFSAIANNPEKLENFVLNIGREKKELTFGKKAKGNLVDFKIKLIEADIKRWIKAKKYGEIVPAIKRIEEIKKWDQVITKSKKGLSKEAIRVIEKIESNIWNHDMKGSRETIVLQIEEIKKLRAAYLGEVSIELAAKFAGDVYDPSNENICGFQRKSAQDYELNDIDLIDEKIGFKSSIYSNGVTTIVSFAGTEDLADWINNMQQGLGIGSAQYKKARSLAKIIRNNAKNQKIVFVGHSLGGGLAAVAGAVTKLKSITFNAAGVHSKTLENFGVFTKNFSNITNHITIGDILTRFQEQSIAFPKALGKQEYHGSYLNYWTYLPIPLISAKLTSVLVGTNLHGKYGME